MSKSVDPVEAFVEAACVPLDRVHVSGTLDDANAILAGHPPIAASSIHTAAILGDDDGVRRFLALDPANAMAKGAPRGWDALTHLCFSRYLRLDSTRSDGFVRAARALLEAGASANTGWYETHHQPEPVWESVLYGAAGIAHHGELTRLLLDHGADPNDAEVVYHTPESYDNAALKALLATGKLTQESLATLLVRKHDWHDLEGVRLLLGQGIDLNGPWRWNPLHHALARDNALMAIELLLDHGADRLIAACARNVEATARSISESEPQAVAQVRAKGGQLLAEFAGNGNTDGVRLLLDLGVPVSAAFPTGDGYFDVAPGSTALHVAAWRARPATVQLLIDRGAPVNVPDGRGRTPLMLAVRAAVDSYWTDRRSPDSVRALLAAGSSTSGVPYPSGYAEVDALLAANASQLRPG